MPNTLLRSLATGLLFAILATGSWAQSKYTIDVRADREDGLYETVQTVTFSIAVIKDGAPLTDGDAAFALSRDGWPLLETGERPLAKGHTPVTGTLNAPGFLRCTVTYTDDTGKEHTGMAAAGFDPLKIPASMAPPEDFDVFWADKKAKIAELPLNPVLTPVETTVADVECFDLQLECLGDAPVSGYYCRPAGGRPNSLAAVLYVHGAGVRSSILRPKNAAEGMLVLDINAHGIPNGKPASYYGDLAKGDLAGYPNFGREDRETSYFLGMYYRLIRALDFLTGQPEWDGKVLIVEGTSQGGGQAIVAAGLDSRVTAFCAGVPAMCDHTGQVNGWPRLVPRDEAGNPDPKIQEAARYFDAMNFATHTKADALFSVGFVDTVCRPTGIYATYNNLRGTKQILNKPLMRHAVAPEWVGMVSEMMKAHIAAHGG
jgi:cephalosporin-C deacetylase